MHVSSDYSGGLFGTDPLAIAGSAPDAARTVRGLVGDRGTAHWLAFADSGFSDSTVGKPSYVHTRQVLDAGPVDVSDIVFDWPNWACMPDEVNGPNSITVSAYLTLANGESRQLVWDGSPTICIEPGETVRNDPLDLSIPAGSSCWLTVSVSAAVRGGAYPCNSLLVDQAGEGCFTAGPDIEHASNVMADAWHPLPIETLMAVPALPIYGPIAMRGTLRSPAPRILVIGDSIADGFADDTLRFPGFVKRALTNRFPLLSLTAAGDTISFLNMAASRRAALIAHCNATHCIYQLGTNDLAGGIDLEWLKRETLVAWTWLAARGISIHACTLMPRTTSTDGFTSLVNQSPMTCETDRVAYNSWIRSGADGLIAGCFDPAVIVETDLNSGLWRVEGGPWTADGAHPSPRGYEAAAACIDPGVFNVAGRETPPA